MADDNVVPFRRPAAPAPPDPRVHSATRRAARPAQELAAAQNEPHQQAHRDAARRQRDEQLVATGRVVPARITLALNAQDDDRVDGPQVDLDCGTWESNPAGDVDGWEQGEATPTAEQVGLLATYTGFPETWFYKPMKPGPLIGRPGEPGWLWMCGPRGCTAVKSDWVDERGVLHYGDDDTDRKPRQHVQGALPIPSGPRAPAKPAAPAAPPKPRKKPVAAVQPALPTRMPDHLRTELMAKLEGRKKGR